MVEDLVTIIVPVYNTEKYILKCLNSIRSQDYRNFEVLIINDGSTDSSPNLIKHFLENDHRFKLISISNSGQGIARYQGIRRAKGKYIAFVDGDDYVAKNWLSILVGDMHKFNVDLVCTNYFNFNNSEISRNKHYSPKILPLSRVETLNAWLEDKRLHGFLVTNLFKTSILKKVNHPIHFRYMEDSFLLGQVIDQCESVLLDDTAIYYYRHNLSGSMRANFTNQNIESLTALTKQIQQIGFKYPDLKEQVCVRKVKLTFFVLLKMSFRNMQENTKLTRQFILEVKELKNILQLQFGKADRLLLKFVFGNQSLYLVLCIRQKLIQFQGFIRRRR